MIACPNCGAVNALGKVFCVACGKKLPASGLVREDLERIGQMAGRRRLIFKIINIVVTVLLALGLALAVWPQTRPFYEDDPGIGAARRFHRKLEALSQSAQQGAAVQAELPADELNAYIRYAVLGNVRGRNGSVRVDTDGIRVRWLMRMFAVDVENVGGFSPVISFEVKLRPARRTGKLRIVGVSFGHLSLMWPFGGTVRDLFVDMCRSRVEWPLVRRLTVVGCTSGKITVRTPDGGVSDGSLKSLQNALPLGGGAAADGGGR